MSDKRFYELQAPLTVRAAALAAGAALVHGDDTLMLCDVAALETAAPDEIAFVRSARHLKGLHSLSAGLCLCTEDVKDPLIALGVQAVAVCPRPDEAFNTLALLLVQPKRASFTEYAISPHARLGKNVQIGAGVCIGPDAQIGDGTVIGPYAVIGPGCVLGKNCIIGANAVVGFTVMGDRVDIRPGAVLGEPGLGVFADENGIVASAHFGSVYLGDEVRIGANSTVDRAVFGQTQIGARSKLDNLVQVSHNVQIGEDCVLASFCGIAGSSVLGNDVMMGGRAGIADHITIGTGARIAAAAAVMKNIPDGEVWGGHPARPLRRYMREQIALRDLATKKGVS
ncbi:MAG: UDP-3-O-(3-hydroxymyristoyl)glucosamine N-acyltransferase [Robiginitomaculum sp.]|nr:UDP-3-O-(3-hydroxymyristoyl)glucosamine N-acyltransferase [Robiginitomaculum sp.]MDQ7078476.1 UDP-3-O-(3-hydroxymyristoyl)glucosamine N-acyltransferase [Robiginitomaculum sp.]